MPQALCIDCPGRSILYYQHHFQVEKLSLREVVHSFRVTQLIKAEEQDLNSYPLGSSTQAFPITCVVMLVLASDH